MLAMMVFVGVLPSVPTAFSQEQAWEALAMDGSVDTLEYDLSRLTFRGSDVRLHRTLGQTFFSVDDAPVGDGLRTVVFTRGTQMRRVTGVPSDALDERAILHSNGHIVWAVQREDGGRYDVNELDVVSAKVVRRFENLFLGSASRVKVMTDGDRTFYVEVAGVKTLTNGFPPVSVQSITLGNNSTTEVNKIWRNAYETIEDVTTDGRVITRIVFENGDQELWYHAGGQSRAIADSYTINGYVLGAQFIGSQVEFFRYQQLMRYEPTTNKTEALSDRLVWDRSVLTQGERLFTHNGVLFYIAYRDSEKRHYIMRRKSGVTQEVGQWNGGPIQARLGMITVARGDVYANGLSVFDVQTGQEIASTGGVVFVDRVDRAMAAIDTRETASVERNGRTIGLGFAQGIAMQDNAHALLVRDGRVWRVTLKPFVWLNVNPPIFGKTAVSPTVFLLKNGMRQTVMNEAIFYSWEPNFLRLVAINEANRNVYRDIGMAPFAPGTMLKTPSRPDVYLVTGSWGIEPVISEASAYEFFGHEWWRNVVTVDQTTLNRYSTAIIGL